MVMVRAMVFNATFYNVSVISWWSALFGEETGVPGENHLPAQVTDKLEEFDSKTDCFIAVKPYFLHWN
jgi:hypothetical protein